MDQASKLELEAAVQARYFIRVIRRCSALKPGHGGAGGVGDRDTSKPPPKFFPTGATTIATASIISHGLSRIIIIIIITKSTAPALVEKGRTCCTTNGPSPVPPMMGHGLCRVPLSAWVSARSCAIACFVHLTSHRPLPGANWSVEPTGPCLIGRIPTSIFQ